MKPGRMRLWNVPVLRSVLLHAIRDSTQGAPPPRCISTLHLAAANVPQPLSTLYKFIEATVMQAIVQRVLLHVAHGLGVLDAVPGLRWCFRRRWTSSLEGPVYAGGL